MTSNATHLHPQSTLCSCTAKWTIYRDVSALHWWSCTCFCPFCDSPNYPAFVKNFFITCSNKHAWVATTPNHTYETNIAQSNTSWNDCQWWSQVDRPAVKHRRGTCTINCKISSCQNTSVSCTQGSFRSVKRLRKLYYIANTMYEAEIKQGNKTTLHLLCI